LKKRNRCKFCKTEKEIDYKDVEFLKKFLTQRGKIIARAYTGNCSKHQRQINNAIKKARNLALLPFIQ